MYAKRNNSSSNSILSSGSLCFLSPEFMLHVIYLYLSRATQLLFHLLLYNFLAFSFQLYVPAAAAATTSEWNETSFTFLKTEATQRNGP